MSAEAAATCDRNNVTNVLRNINGIYRFSSRVKLLENTLEKPDTSEDAPCVQMSFVNEHTCRVNVPGSKCLLTCGSPGEVANDPRAGHNFPIITEFSIHSVDWKFDRQRYVRHFRAKQSVWGQHAMFAEDQLRQRMANAFANYKDLLR